MSADIGLLVAGGGPAPVRTLARTACLARDWSSWSAFGLDGLPPVPNLPAVMANSERVARYAHKDMAGHLRRHGIDLIEGLGPVSFAGPRTMAADGGRTCSADRIILAVGGHGGRLPIPGAENALTYEDIPFLAGMPRRVAVIGGPDTGGQIASIFADLGAAVTIFEAGPVLVPAADPSVPAELGRAYRAWGMNVATDTMVEALGREGGGLRIDHRSGTILGAHVVGEYSAETVQTVAGCMTAGMTARQVAELRFAFPAFTEAVGMAAQKSAKTIGAGRFPQVWSYLGTDE